MLDDLISLILSLLGIVVVMIIVIVGIALLMDRRPY